MRYARWRGLALARVEVGLAVVMLKVNVLKWRKLHRGQLEPI